LLGATRSALGSKEPSRAGAAAGTASSTAACQDECCVSLTRRGRANTRTSAGAVPAESEFVSKRHWEAFGDVDQEMMRTGADT
jgi:hypothetical protein